MNVPRSSGSGQGLPGASVERCLPPGPPVKASFVLPRGACDTHLHVLGPFDAFPLSDERSYEPPPAPFEEMAGMLDEVGFDRAVVAHVSAHGSDLSVTLDALARLGERARGVALLKEDPGDAGLLSLHRKGIRGVRLSSAYGSGTPIDEPTLRHWAARIAPLGWHIAMWPSSLEELRRLLRLVDELAAPLVLDHLAAKAWRADGDLEQPGFRCLLDLLATGRAWLKLSGMYRASSAGSPWPELVPFARRLLERHPDRLLWASDWPFVGLSTPPMPQTGELLDWLLHLGADEGQRRKILVRNPERLYGFEPVNPP